MDDNVFRSIFEKVGLALRWKHSSLDDEIKDNIRAAQDELIRVGVPEADATSNKPLIVRAVKTYCKAFSADSESDREGLMAAFYLQADNLRKSTKLSREEPSDGVQ